MARKTVWEMPQGFVKNFFSNDKTNIGLLKDNPETAWKMAEYLEAHKHVDNDTRI